MPEVTEYAPGTPSWVDLASPDPDASRRFYGGLFGWEATDPGPVEESGGYRMLQRDGRNVAGLGPTQAEGQPAVWTTYVSTDDADAIAARVREAGGQVIMEPFDVLGAGRMAVFADPTGAFISVWQPQSHHGADVVDEPGTLCWNELATRDVDAAKRFYAAVFAWQGDTRGPGRQGRGAADRLAGRALRRRQRPARRGVLDHPAHSGGRRPGGRRGRAPARGRRRVGSPPAALSPLAPPASARPPRRPPTAARSSAAAPRARR
jgi:predicted enzyme related to lactoylglutathione lyase